MKVYVSGPVSDTRTVRQVQHAVLAAGHELTLHWSADVPFAGGYASQMERSARMAREELDHVVLVGEIHHESLFYFHPLVQHVAAVGDWPAQISVSRSRPLSAVAPRVWKP